MRSYPKSSHTCTRPPNPVTHVQRPLEHGEKFDRRWYPNSKFDGRGQKDTVMYHPNYRGANSSGNSARSNNARGTTTSSGNMDQWQKGFMSRQAVSGEATTSTIVDQTTNPGATDPNY